MLAYHESWELIPLIMTTIIPDIVSKFRESRPRVPATTVVRMGKLNITVASWIDITEGQEFQKTLVSMKENMHLYYLFLSASEIDYIWEHSR
jgi:hypothetical protein